MKEKIPVAEPIIIKCQQCNNELRSDQIKKHFLNTNHLEFELGLNNTKKEKLTAFHSMGDSLFKYINMKIHHLVEEQEYEEIVVKGKYDRWATISNKEKNDKLFNWKRPTARVNGKKLHILCFPGQDYVIHYSLIIFYHFYINNLNIPKIIIHLPTDDICTKSLDKTNLSSLPKQDVVIMGYIDRLISNFPDWEGEEDFKWKRFHIFNQNVALLGCKFSYWADIGGRIIKFLAQRDTKLVIYIGKLGSLIESHIPNNHLATGEESLLNEEVIRWKSPFQGHNKRLVKDGKHITLPSILMETKEWLKKNQEGYSFVDPEIGYMAKASLEEDIGFGFIHIISDNIKKEYDENLSNERQKSVLEKRELIIKEIRNALNRVFEDGRN